MAASVEKVDILAIGVHPDDIELACSGTLLRHLEAGYRVGLLDLTRGELGSRGSADIRTQEATRAAEMLGVSFRWNADMADGFFAITPENTRKIIQYIRACRPRVVLANALHDRHPDHGRAAKLVAEACFYSGLLRIETTDAHGESQEKWRPENVFHYIQDRNLEPDFVVDITPYVDRKMEIIMAYGSQFHNPEAEAYKDEVSTPISGTQFKKFLRAKAAGYGRESGYDYAEGFNVTRVPGVRDLFDLK